MDLEVHSTFCELHARVNPREVVVGWCAVAIPPCPTARRYATGDGIQWNDAKIHSHYQTLTASPVHLVLDTSLAGTTLGMRAFETQNMSLGGKSLGIYFQQVLTQV